MQCFYFKRPIARHLAITTVVAHVSFLLAFLFQGGVAKPYSSSLHGAVVKEFLNKVAKNGKARKRGKHCRPLRSFILRSGRGEDADRVQLVQWTSEYKGASLWEGIQQVESPTLRNTCGSFPPTCHITLFYKRNKQTFTANKCFSPCFAKASFLPHYNVVLWFFGRFRAALGQLDENDGSIWCGLWHADHVPLVLDGLHEIHLCVTLTVVENCDRFTDWCDNFSENGRYRLFLFLFFVTDRLSNVLFMLSYQ